jgi:hypothetical protein
MNGKLNNIGSAGEINKKNITAETQGLFHPAEANLGYFPAWFQSLQLPTTQSESPLAQIPLAHKCHVSFKVIIFRSGLSETRINCNQISEGLL